MKNKKIPIWTVIRSKTQILETGEQILSGNITLILITSLVYSNSSFKKFLWIRWGLCQTMSKMRNGRLIYSFWMGEECEVTDTNCNYKTQWVYEQSLYINL
jgi:hypothetical protein